MEIRTLNILNNNSDMPAKVIKENLDILNSFLCTSVNRNIRKQKIKTYTFLQCLKLVGVTPL